MIDKMVGDDAEGCALITLRIYDPMASSSLRDQRAEKIMAHKYKLSAE